MVEVVATRCSVSFSNECSRWRSAVLQMSRSDDKGTSVLVLHDDDLDPRPFISRKPPTFCCC